MNDRLIDFLRLVQRQDWRNVPKIWSDEVRMSLSDGLITIGWGGALKLTDAGRAALVSEDRTGK